MPRRFLEMMVEFSDTTAGILRTSDEPWLNLIEAARSIWGERWALYRMAVRAAANVKGMKVIDCSLADRGIPLFTRAARARQAGGDRQWWLKELGTVQGMDALSQQFTFFALYSSMPIDDILALSSTLGTALDLLPEEQWLGLAETATRLPWRRIHKRHRQRDQIAATKLPTSMSPRLACFLLLRASPATARLIRHRYLADYRGNDRAVLAAITDVVIEHAFEYPQAWGEALPEIAHAYSHNVLNTGRYGPYLHRRHVVDMPLLEARRICAEASAYPLLLVSLAEAQLAAQTGAEAIPVGKIAARDGWFVDR
jgi:hypothetical protein